MSVLQTYVLQAAIYQVKTAPEIANQQDRANCQQRNDQNHKVMVCPEQRS